MTARRSAPTANRNFALHGGNADSWDYRPKAGGELVVYSGAGKGKTVGNLLRLLDYGDTYPGARILIIRKTRVSLTESALATWENLILGQGHPVLGNAIQRTSRHQYLWPNSSVLVTGGMDKSDKVLSTEWDLIYCPECNELDVDEWETLNNRIRAMAGPYDLLFGDCNPTVPSHWICRRAKAKQLKLVSTQLQDNPQYYDEDSREWTELGRRYHTGWRVRTKSKSVKDDMLRRRFSEPEAIVAVHDPENVVEPTFEADPILVMCGRMAWSM